MKESQLFTPVKIGPLTLRNRTIRAAAFEGMCPGNAPSEMLHDYHLSVARGGIGMTTIYARVCIRDARRAFVSAPAVATPGGGAGAQAHYRCDT